MADDITGRILGATILAVRRRCVGIDGAEVLERDGLVLSLTNLPEPSLNAAFVAAEPSDPRRALRWAEEEMGGRGHALAIDYPVGRWPSLDRAVRDAGLERVDGRPIMVARADALPPIEAPAGVAIRRVSSGEDALALARVDALAFGTDPSISEAAFAPGVLGIEGAIGLVAWGDDGRPVGCAVAHEGAGATGIFGVGVVPGARGRGIGAALTLAAARAFPGDLAWLLPSEMARPMYERLGFRAWEMWEVWVRASG
jgi:GNAT superfamily N-acetyltransferase